MLFQADESLMNSFMFPVDQCLCKNHLSLKPLDLLSHPDFRSRVDCQHDELITSNLSCYPATLFKDTAVEDR